ncbi:glycoside hydrolase family 76 protein [Bacteroides thetaiotaomicron]|uniref:glycoside hydrolase family 76 protein n=1 Tax=Bacteroides thetaiotaomicron TaxID=818 RepID=UPI002165AF98|nr:glycoside hydrolase family 76 protein [Bacteroides thetaiotaomicron]MCS3198390.1 glycoside hydrolase family 76 protein [Bacteroides thetaiotaomicron]
MEEPPLTYTQGTFGEACRQLYHITQESKYMDKAKQVINYAATQRSLLTKWHFTARRQQ